MKADAATWTRAQADRWRAALASRQVPTPGVLWSMWLVTSCLLDLHRAASLLSAVPPCRQLCSQPAHSSSLGRPKRSFRRLAVAEESRFSASSRVGRADDEHIAYSGWWSDGDSFDLDMPGARRELEAGGVGAMAVGAEGDMGVQRGAVGGLDARMQQQVAEIGGDAKGLEINNMLNRACWSG